MAPVLLAAALVPEASTLAAPQREDTTKTMKKKILFLRGEEAMAEDQH